MIDGVVFGAGYLGNRFGEELKYRVVSRSEVDTTDFFAVDRFLQEYKPKVVINAVGKTGHPGSLGIDGCKGHEFETWQSNVLAANVLSLATEMMGSYFVHIGSGCIYQGNNNGNGFSEIDPSNFKGVQYYSDSKQLAERDLSKRPGLILRIRMPIDDRPNPRNLVDKLKGYHSVIDIPNSMTTIPDMIPAVKQIIDMKLNGVYNFVNPGVTTAVEIMNRYKELVDSSHVVNIMTLDELDSAVTQRRSNCILSDKKLRDAGIILPEIHEAVDSCLIRYAKCL